MSTARYIIGDVRDVLRTIPDGSVDLIVTSPPFLALRSYLPADHPWKAREIGSESTPAGFLDVLLELTVEWRRVLAPHGSIAVELGDTYAGSTATGGDYKPEGEWTKYKRGDLSGVSTTRRSGVAWPLDKSLAGIPSLYAWSLAYGRNLLNPEHTIEPWRVRNLLVWARPNPPVGALGDKWRPATSFVTVACTGRSRYFDLDAVRTPFLHPVHNDANKRRGGPTYGKKGPNPDRGDLGASNFASDHAGAPPLDWLDERDIAWQPLMPLPTQPYAGSHYATFPSALPARLIECMAPRRVCTTCGTPSTRIVERETFHLRNGQSTRGGGRGDGVAGLGSVGHDNATGSRIIAEAWSDCGHGSFACGSCGVVVPYDYALRRPRASSGSEAEVCSQEVLGEPVEVAGVSPDDSGRVRAMRDRVHGQAGGTLLHPQLFGEAGSRGGTSEHGRTADGDAGPEAAPGVLEGVGARRNAGPDEVGSHVGAPVSDAGASRPPARAVGDRPSPQRREDGQQDREPRGGDASASRRVSDLPALSGDVPGQLTWSCPSCGGHELRYVEDHWRPGVVLDPFAGSGTTLAVATGAGRDAIGIDLDARNADLARERIGMFMTLEGGTVGVAL